MSYSKKKRSKFPEHLIKERHPKTGAETGVSSFPGALFEKDLLDFDEKMFVFAVLHHYYAAGYPPFVSLDRLAKLMGCNRKKAVKIGERLAVRGVLPRKKKGRCYQYYVDALFGELAKAPFLPYDDAYDIVPAPADPAAPVAPEPAPAQVVEPVVEAPPPVAQPPAPEPVVDQPAPADFSDFGEATDITEDGDPSDLPAPASSGVVDDEEAVNEASFEKVYALGAKVA